jgi:hypothetical protein
VGIGTGSAGICVEGPALDGLPFGSAEFRSPGDAIAAYNEVFSFWWNLHYQMLQLTPEPSGGSDSVHFKFVNQHVR